ncbi:MAG: hypothetical protein ACRECE_08520 [Xanthobacteraceae bacterium]
MMKKSAFAYKKGSIVWFALSLALAAAMSGFWIAFGPRAVANAEPQHGEIVVTCTNPYSGASWQIRIDYQRRTVDSNPAEVDDSTISWRDAANGWYYALDRKTGKLTVTMASATGGNFLHDQCKLDH